MTWLQIALLELGDAVSEVPGPGDNPRIREYHAATSLGPSPDEVPWCSSFLNWAVEQAGMEGTQSARARSWQGWGVPSPPRFGAVAVLSRGPDPATGHVGFVVGLRGGQIYLLGGNQSDRVSIAKYPESRVVACRWPQGVSQ